MSKRVANKKGKGVGARCERKISKYAKKKINLPPELSDAITAIDPVVTKPNAWQNMKSFFRRKV